MAERRFELVASGPILDELEADACEAVLYAQRLTSEAVARPLKAFGEAREGATLVIELADVRGVATTPADDLILATAVAGGASHLVTGDRQLRSLDEYEGVRIVGPRAFVDWLDAGLAGDVG